MQWKLQHHNELWKTWLLPETLSFQRAHCFEPAVLSCISVFWFSGNVYQHEQYRSNLLLNGFIPFESLPILDISIVLPGSGCDSMNKSDLISYTVAHFSGYCPILFEAPYLIPYQLEPEVNGLISHPFYVVTNDV